jgi:HD-GYP domain-containing protein (c-di-GMP phosphodiesterase class II)
MSGTKMFEYQDTLETLNQNIPLRDKLRFIHQVLQDRFTSIDRISIALYDPKTDLLKTYLDSSGEDRPIRNYQAKLSDAASLKEVLVQGNPRVVNDLDAFLTGNREHTTRMRKQGYKASYTMPMLYDGTFFGFAFFDSYQKNVMRPEVLHHLDVFGHLISLLIANELNTLRTLLAAVKTASDMTHLRDLETGTHLDRMSRYTRLIAEELADNYSLEDDYIEHIFMFSPLHDIGKIGIPDHILLKPSELTDEEFEVMKTHTRKGRHMIDVMLENFGLSTLQHIDILRNIAEYHHESVNGNGYPEGLCGDAIPLEARIVAVADVFDALTSQRPYKDAWSNDDAFAMLRRLAGSQLDWDCVEALVRNRNDVKNIQSRFREDPYG